MLLLLRSALAVIVGIVGGGIVNMALVMLTAFLFMPAGLNMSDQAALAEAWKDAPLAAFLLILLAHSGGTLVGAWLAAKIAGRAPLVHALIIGVFFLVGGIMNLRSIPHPLWFAIADLILYLLAAWLGGKIVRDSRLWA